MIYLKITSFDTHGEKNEQKVMVEKYEEVLEKSNEKRFVYFYINDMGKHYIYKYINFVSIIREGSTYLNQTFNKFQKTPMLYQLDNYSLNYMIFTHNIILNDKKIFIEYDIMDGDNLINSIKLEIVECEE